MNKYLIFFIFSIPINGLLCQDLNDFIDSFRTPDNWRKSITIDSSFHAFYNNGKVAKITLINDFREFEIIIFEKRLLNNDDFLNAEEETNYRSSCRNFNLRSKFFRMSSFTTSRFYIVPVLCPDCNFDEDQKCRKIYKRYARWSNKWFSP